MIDFRQDWDCRDARQRPSIRTLSEAIERLREPGRDLDLVQCQIQAPPNPSYPTAFAGLSYARSNDETGIIAFLMLQGCWVKTMWFGVQF